MERRVERRLRGLLARDRRESLADVLERERIVPDDAPVLVDELDRGLRRLAVALDRRRLAESGHALVGQRDVDDVRVVGRLARDDERLRELQAHDPSLDLHLPKLPRGARDGDDVGDDVCLLLAADEPGWHHAASLLHRGRDLRAVEARSDEDGPDTAALAAVAVTSRALALEDRLAAIDVAAGDCDARGRDGSKICAFASANVPAATAPPTRIGLHPRRIRTRTGRS